MCLNATDGRVLWNYVAASGMGRPAVADGKVYVGCQDKKLYRLNASTGAKVWSYTTDGPVYNPIVASGIVYAIGGGRIYAFGSLKTSCSISIGVSPSSVNVGQTLAISGAISSAHSASVTITYRWRDGGTWAWQTLTKVTSDSTGAYSCSLTPSYAATFDFYASWSARA